MLLIQNILAFLSAAYRNAQLEAQRIYARLVGIVLLACALILVMWAVNAYGDSMGLSLILFFVGSLLVVILGFAPRPYVYGLLAGLGFYGLQDKDLSQGAAQGLKWAFNVTIGILFGFCLMAGLLATWSFKHDPAAFWYIAAMATVIVLTVNLFLKNSGKMFATIVIAYAVIVIVIAAWGTVSTGAKDSVAAFFTIEENLPEARFLAPKTSKGLPTNVWSEPIRETRPNCRVIFAEGEGKVYNTQYRVSYPGMVGVEWKDHIPGTFPVMNEWRYMLLIEGIESLPYAVNC